jgi:Domain of unknown function (DUF4124)
MESSLKIKPSTLAGTIALLAAVVLLLSVTPLAADTYRWKDKDGKTHYGEAVPAEYADQPYDVLNNQGIVIRHIDDTTKSVDAMTEEEPEKKEREPLISAEERQVQTDRLLIVRYASEEEITKALNLELDQLSYDTKVINQSLESTKEAIRSQISQAADQQRAGQQISAEQQQQIEQLYARRAGDEKQQAAMQARQERIRARYAAELERFRFLTSGSAEDQPEPGDKG